MDCPFCPEKFGKDVSVSLTYMPTHMANFHRGQRPHAPAVVRTAISKYRKGCRENRKKRRGQHHPSRSTSRTEQAQSMQASDAEEDESVEEDVEEEAPPQGAFGQMCSLGQASSCMCVSYTQGRVLFTDLLTMLLWS